METVKAIGRRIRGWAIFLLVIFALVGIYMSIYDWKLRNAKALVTSCYQRLSSPSTGCDSPGIWRFLNSQQYSSLGKVTSFKIVGCGVDEGLQAWHCEVDVQHSHRRIKEYLIGQRDSVFCAVIDPHGMGGNTIFHVSEPNGSQ